MYGLSVASGSFTLDLNGKTITLGMNASGSEPVASSIVVSQGAGLVVQDSSSGGMGTVATNAIAVSLLTNAGNLTIRGGTFKESMGSVVNNGTLNLSGNPTITAMLRMVV